MPYRLTVLVQIAGSLVLAAGIPLGFENGGNIVIVVGYVIMRLALVSQWLRAAASDPARRATNRRYAAGATLVQLFWLLLLLAPEGLFFLGFVLAGIAELAVPAVAERASRRTSTRTTSRSGTGCSPSSCWGSR